MRRAEARSEDREAARASCWRSPGPRRKALDEIRALTKSAGVDAGSAAGGDERAACGAQIARHRCPSASASPRASAATWNITPASCSSCGRAMPKAPVQIAGGGRYDTLLEQLGADETHSRHRLRHPHRARAGRAQRGRRTMSARLTLAVPSKGRLQEQVHAYFADAGLPLKQGGRRARLSRHARRACRQSMCMLLSASEIAAALLSGDVHLGVTGEDLIRETAPRARRPRSR